MTGRLAVSFAWGNQALGHASRLAAVHTELRALGWDSLFFADQEHRLLRDHGFPQLVLPMYRECVIGEAWSGSAAAEARQRLAGAQMNESVRLRAAALLDAPAGDRRRLAELIVEEAAGHADLVLHDVLVHGALYATAARRQTPQAYLHRPRTDRPDPAAWVAAEVPAIGTVYAIGAPVPAGSVRVREVADVIRRPLDDRPVWGPEDTGLRVAVTAGGGGHPDAEEFLTAAVAGVAAFLGSRPASVLVVTGPFFTGRLTLPPVPGARVTVTGYVDPRHSLYRDTDLLVCQGGYNTVQEIRHHGVPVVAVPGPRMLDDQRGRLSSAGVRVAGPVPDEIAAGLAEVAGRDRDLPAPAPVDGPPGARQVAEDLTALVPAR
ncbi:glycosyltransferase [Micromonospora sp. CA-259024]|uniref:glycosyltransferase n=1 Tax=Micromonospora sp. CA-259024 TaxID=3239965 RepID=UPI003D8BA84A